MGYLRTNFRLRGNIVDMQKGAQSLTALGAIVPSGYLCYSNLGLMLYRGDYFLQYSASTSTGA